MKKTIFIALLFFLVGSISLNATPHLKVMYKVRQTKAKDIKKSLDLVYNNIQNIGDLDDLIELEFEPMQIFINNLVWCKQLRAKGGYNSSYIREFRELFQEVTAIQYSLDIILHNEHLRRSCNRLDKVKFKLYCLWTSKKKNKKKKVKWNDFINYKYENLIDTNFLTLIKD